MVSAEGPPGRGSKRMQPARPRASHFCCVASRLVTTWAGFSVDGVTFGIGSGGGGAARSLLVVAIGVGGGSLLVLLSPLQPTSAVSAAHVAIFFVHFICLFGLWLLDFCGLDEEPAVPTRPARRIRAASRPPIQQAQEL